MPPLRPRDASRSASRDIALSVLAPQLLAMPPGRANLALLGLFRHPADEGGEFSPPVTMARLRGTLDAAAQG